LAFDADYFLDLHCDCEGVLHFYCEEPCWAQLEPLSRFLGSETNLLAKNSGSGPIDECLSGVWWRLADMLKAQNNSAPLPQGCCSTTIELRGELDVTHANAKTDAQAIVYFLQHIGVLLSKQQPAVPAPRCQPTPLAGSETLRSAVPGVIVFAAQPGQTLKAGDLVAEVIDPIENTVHRVCTSVNGVFYARVRDRYTTAGGEIGKVASATAFRTGELLGA
jgi:predicted deacylase